jgi:hypothetical protein
MNGDREYLDTLVKEFFVRRAYQEAQLRTFVETWIASHKVHVDIVLNLGQVDVRFYRIKGEPKI